MRSLTIVGIAAMAVSAACAQDSLDLDKLLNPQPATETPAAVAPDSTPAATPPAATPESGSAMKELLGNAAPDEIKAVQGDAATPVVATTPEEVSVARQAEEMEKVRREHAEIKARKALDEAEALYKSRKYRDAISKFEEAIRDMPDRPATRDAIDLARLHMAEASLDWAESEYALDNLAEAKKLAEQAKSRNDAVAPRATRLLSRIQSRMDRSQKETTRAVPVAERPEIVSGQKAVLSDYEEGVRLFVVEEYDRAEKSFEAALLRNPYHRDSMRYLRAIQERKLAARETHRQVAIARMTDEVRSRWNPPLRQELRGPEQKTDDGPEQGKEGIRAMRSKLDRIIIPSLVFRDANIEDVINFLGEASRANDTDGVGVSFIMKLGGGSAAGASAAPAATSDDPWAMPTAPVVAPSSGSGSAAPNLTLNLKHVSLMQAIKYITEMTRLQYQIEEYAVVILPEGTQSGDMETRVYPVLPSLIETTVSVAETQPNFTEEGGGLVSKSTTMARNDVLELFKSFGVDFPPGASISYNNANSRLIVVNTIKNLEELERILREINAIPSQVEIETRFVEVNQDDLDELGFQWLLDNDWTVANQKAPGGGSVTKSIQVNANNTGTSAGNLGFTKGNRFFSNQGDTPSPVSRADVTQNLLLGSLFSVSSILTNPQLTMVLHALEQRGGTDLLSAPRITTKSGNNAQIQVVEELLYPTEYVEQSLREGDSNVYRPPIPSSFESRGVGVILNVTPNVGPDGYTIDLTLVPEIAELVGWIDYSPQGWYPMNMPIFTSRNIQTGIVIWDGQTVAMGGLIRDRTTRMNDRIPLLGDIPLLGRLFRSKGEYSAKRNMMVFVTAKMIDPSGMVIRDPKMAQTMNGVSKP